MGPRMPSNSPCSLAGTLNLSSVVTRVLNERGEVRAGDTQTRMRTLPVAARVSARTPSASTDLFNQQNLQAGNIRAGELGIDTAVSGHVADEVIDDCGDGRLTAEAIIETQIRFGRLGIAGDEAGEGCAEH